MARHSGRVHVPVDDATERTGIASVNVGLGSTPAVLVVDLQRSFTRPEHELGADLSGVIEHTNRLLGAAREVDAPVVFARHVLQPAGEPVGMTRKVPALADLVPDSEWVEIDDRLDRRDDDYVVEKTQASAFHATELDDYLTALGVDTLLLTGTTTSGCIRAAAIDACSHGYRTTVPRECVGDRSPEQGDANLVDIDARYADVRALDDVLADLRGQ